MRVSRLDRRDFLEAMFLVGLSACGGPRWGRSAVKSSRPAGAAMGPFFQRLALLSDELARGGSTADEYAHRAGAELMELELEEDVLDDWRRAGPAEEGVGHNGYRTIDTRALRFGDRPGAAKVILFYTPAWTANPPHEHHNLISCKRVLVGSYHVRQYERLRGPEPGIIRIRQVSELVDVNLGGPYIDMTDGRLNVHWFGARARPVLAINIVVENALRPADTFHGERETRAAGQYYIDPTGAPDRDGVILAPAIERERAAEFARRPLSDFPSLLAAGGRPA